MDGALASVLYQTVCRNDAEWPVKSMWQRVGGRRGGVEATSVSSGGAATGADLGGSSKYSNENFEDWSGEGFHVNSSWTWVSRP